MHLAHLDCLKKTTNHQCFGAVNHWLLWSRDDSYPVTDTPCQCPSVLVIRNTKLLVVQWLANLVSVLFSEDQRTAKHWDNYRGQTLTNIIMIDPTLVTAKYPTQKCSRKYSNLMYIFDVSTTDDTLFHLLSFVMP